MAGNSSCVVLQRAPEASGSKHKLSLHVAVHKGKAAFVITINTVYHIVFDILLHANTAPLSSTEVVFVYLENLS